MKKFLKSKLFIVSALLLTVFLGGLVLRETYKKYQIEQEIEGLNREISRLERKNQEIFNFIQYLNTDEYKERQARSLLNLQKPGEFAVALPQEQGRQKSQRSENSQDQKNPNFDQWWDYFFGRSDPNNTN